MKKIIIGVCSMFVMFLSFIIGINTTSVSAAENIKVSKVDLEITIPTLTYYAYECDPETALCTFDKNDSITTSITLDSHVSANNYTPSVEIRDLMINELYVVYGFGETYNGAAARYVFNTQKNLGDFRNQLYRYIGSKDIYNSFDVFDGSNINPRMMNVLGFSVPSLFYYGIDLNDETQYRALFNAVEDMLDNPAKYIKNVTNEDYNKGYSAGYTSGQNSVDITVDNEEAYQTGYTNGFNAGSESVDITIDNDAVYESGFMSGQASVDITSDNESVYQEGFLAGQESVDITSDNLEVYKEAYNKGYTTGKEIGIEEGKASIDVNAIRQEAYNNGFNEGVISVDITQDNQAIYEEAYQEGMDDGLIIGFENGKNSIDVSAIEQEAYDRGYQNGYNVGFAEGEYSVDITKDNDTAIHLYITQNKYHSDHEFNLNFDLGYNAGIKFVYDNIENDEVVTKYVKDYIYVKKYYTSTEYIDNYDEGYQSGFKYGYDNGFVEGKEVIYKTIESDPIIKEYYKEKLINGTKITFVNEGDEVVKVVKNYDINETDTGDFKIIIHNGQDTYRVETVENVIPGENNTTEIVKESDNSDLIDFFSKFGLILLVFIGTVGIIWLFKGITNISFKGRRNSNEKSFAV